MSEIGKRNVCITHTTKRVIDHAEIFETNKDILKFLVVGTEFGKKKGRRHYQAYAEFNKLMYNAGLKRIFQVEEGESHRFENRFASATEAAKYCMKDGDYVSFGSPKAKDKISMAKLFKKVKEGASNIELLEENPNVAKDRNCIEWMRDAIIEDKSVKAEREFDEYYLNISLFPHQETLISMLESQDNRRIAWVYDNRGNSGKSTLAYHLQAKYPDNVAILTNGKSTDILFAWNHEEYVIFDFTRSVEGRINFNAIEQLKNGMVFSGKYKSKSKKKLGVKVMCFANFYPKTESLSLDRWSISELISSSGGPDGVIIRSVDLSHRKTTTKINRIIEFDFDSDSS